MNPRVYLLILLSFSLIAVLPAMGQNHTIDFGAGYTYTRTNLVPGCNCFSLQGGHLEVQAGLAPHFAIIANLDVGAGSNITPDGYQLTQLTYTLGARYMPVTSRHLSPFAESLIGGAHAFGSLSPGNNSVGGSSNAFALRAGGGLLLRLTPQLELIPAQVGYLLTNFHNSANNCQNDLQVSTGLLFRLRK
jgi:hypothetical protein